MKILFICGLFPLENIKYYKSNSRGSIQHAANNLQWAFIKGLEKYFECDIISLPYIGSYPFRFKKIFVRAEEVNKKCTIGGFINLPFIKYISRYLSLAKILEKKYKYNDNYDLIIVYAVHTPFLKAASAIKKKFQNTKVCLIVPDLPKYMSESKNILYLLLKQIDQLLINRLLKNISYYVYLTKYMDILCKSSAPSTVIEGIFFDSEQYIEENKVRNNNYKVVLYSGTLDKRYGIEELLNSLKYLQKNYQLWLCGDGNYKSQVVAYSKRDDRIKYFGQLSNDTVRKLQRNATVLVNPRTSKDKYTMYSFPSKTIEYLASGTPTIIHSLPGIPREYFSYCFVPLAETSEALATTIKMVCEKDETELKEFGQRARNFIIGKKNPETQVKKLYDLIMNY